MSTLIWIILAFCLGLYYGARRMRRKQAAAPAPAPTPATPAAAETGGGRQTEAAPAQEDSEREDAARNDYHSDGAFRREFAAEPLCNGFKCNPEVQCNIYERLFCQNVMRRVSPNPGRDWTGQYWVKTLKIWRRVDFAIAVKTRPGTPARALAIEFDGFKSHAKLDFDKFQKQLQRQNDLFMKGWGILRFTFLDLANRPEKCVEMIRGAIHSSNCMSTAGISLPLRFADVENPKNPGTEPARMLKSESRGKCYIPLFKEGDAENFGSHRVWAPCPRSVCTGRAFGGGGRWACDTCGGEFPERDGMPAAGEG